MLWTTTRFDIDLSRPRVMGIVNLTPDSFSDGGQFPNPSAALRHCERLIEEGADLLDIGAESSRPGSQPIDREEELRRLLPVVSHAVTLGVPISVDTYKPEVMRACLDLGVDVVNDIWALRWGGERSGEPSALDVVSTHPRCGVCLMHMHGQPQNMQVSPMVGPAWPQVLDFLRDRADLLLARGIDRRRIFVDPGIGFGKTVDQNVDLLAQQHRLNRLGLGVLVGWSRKSTLGVLAAGEDSDRARSARPWDRVAASVAAAVLAADRGAHVLRVHDVRETVHALRVRNAVAARAATDGPLPS